MTTSNPRDKGTGSVYQLGNGKWMAQVELPRIGSKRRYRRTTHNTKPEARAALRNLQGEVESGVIRNRNVSVSNYMNMWLTDIAPLTVKPGTVQTYRKVFRNWIEPYIGAVPLSDLTPEHVAQMLSELQRDGKAPKTRQYALVVLRRSLKWADRTNKITRNPASADQIDGPKVSNQVHDALTAAEARKVLAAASGDRWEAIAIVALKLGLRQGELLRLRWDDVNLDTGELTVRSSKTEGSFRTIPLVNGTADALKAHKRRQQQDSIVRELHPGYVFTWEDGRPIAPRTLLKWWHKLTMEALGERRRFHATRHTCAVLLLDADVPLNVVSAVLGHANLAITSDLYAKPTADLLRRELTKLDQQLENHN